MESHIGESTSFSPESRMSLKMVASVVSKFAPNAFSQRNGEQYARIADGFEFTSNSFLHWRIEINSCVQFGEWGYLVDPLDDKKFLCPTFFKGKYSPF